MRRRIADRILGRLLLLSQDEANFDRRGFASENADARERLEAVGRTFISGYNHALAGEGLAALERRLGDTPLIDRGFAFEGAAMALALLDLLTPWRRDRLAELLSGPGRDHCYMVHVGVGWALARLGRGQRALPDSLDPLLRWLTWDGYGFHEGYFHPGSYLSAQRRPRRLAGYALRAFDQGLGRSLWFAEGANIARVAAVVAEFPVHRRGDLWSGVGLAAAYAGGVGEPELVLLHSLAQDYTSHLAQGAAFAAKARERANAPAAHTELACRVLCGSPANAAAEATEEALKGLRGDANLPEYEIWRRRIRVRYSSEATVQ